jgi:hypothetical protein
MGISGNIFHRRHCIETSSEFIQHNNEYRAKRYNS